MKYSTNVYHFSCLFISSLLKGHGNNIQEGWVSHLATNLDNCIGTIEFTSITKSSDNCIDKYT